ncbi:NADP-dependent phosphogluconate dehydrogenase [Brooklawnia cerclae]|uniref:6-phosphogluconate dehydrogenase, decarboxylating n=1 Tax=Brooklawnia cerclae TaxID=349934 RepID=A0ABX0SKU3_9ACTN|nr:NADP-dependent phosphogluconate dehydrogenase [Brooklawnia cerclae]NIH57351.1 6-phosphogluconate dehydrogenase [Brooklawnia cerclae]
MSDEKANIGVVGMAVMGSNLARNLAHHGYAVAIYNRTFAKTQAVMDEHGSEGTFIPGATVEEFVASIAHPRSIILMVKAGAATDATIEELLPYLEPGDIIVDAGNSFFRDTIRREKEISEKGFHFVGTGVSGGEYGALTGPSIMPGGTPESYTVLGPMLEAISAHVGDEPCCTWIGPNGAGHFVKMIHNGIEYSDMQVIGEAYELLKAAGIGTDEAAAIFKTWNQGELSSYLIEITADLLQQADPQTGAPLVDVIKDRAGMKGTGTWTVTTALELGVPVNGIAESVFARAESSHDDLRRVAQTSLQGPDRTLQVPDKDAFVEDVRRALWASKVVAYSQGFDEIRTGGQEFGWNINVADCAKIWRDGCIIRAKLLENIRQEYSASPDLVSLMCAPSIAPQLADYQDAWRRVVAAAAQAGVPAPVFSSSLAYYDMARAPRNNAAVTQGLRDYFGSHTYERVDAAGHYHLEWSGDRSEIKTSDN